MHFIVLVIKSINKFPNLLYGCWITWSKLIFIRKLSFEYSHCKVKTRKDYLITNLNNTEWFLIEIFEHLFASIWRRVFLLIFYKFLECLSELILVFFHELLSFQRSLILNCLNMFWWWIFLCVSCNYEFNIFLFIWFS